MFVVFPGTSDRIKQGLAGAVFPYIVQTVQAIQTLDSSMESTVEAVEILPELD